MVEYTEGSNGAREFEGTISKIENEQAQGKFPEQYKITITTTSDNAKDWKPQTIWISIPTTSTPEKIPEKSFLGYMCKQLESFGLKGKTHKDLIDTTFGKKFKFKDTTPKVNGEIITKKDKLVWVKLIE